jgi:hypothetical protein
MAGIAWEQASQVVGDAAVELGLAEPADVFASTDEAVIRLRRLLTSLGRDLVMVHDWSHLQKTHTITTSNGDYTYDLPTDFNRMIEQTHWNRTTVSPGIGLSPQQWQHIQANSVSSTINLLFRAVNNEVWISPTPSGTATLAFEYISSYWVDPTPLAAATTDRVSANTDYLYFEPRLLVTGLKYYWQRSKGFDSLASQQDFEQRLAACIGADGSSPSLHLGIRRQDNYLLGLKNMPDNGYGG